MTRRERKIAARLARLAGKPETRRVRRARWAARGHERPMWVGELKKRRVVLACDKWDRVADNIAAIAAHVEALRGQERWGVGSLEQAFAGYAKLPSPEAARDWRTVLGLANGSATLDAAERRFRELAMLHHPDRGGSAEQMAQLNAAIQTARKELAG